MPYICELPDLDTSITFRRPDGSDIKTVDIAELEAVLIQARVDDPKFDHTNPLSLNAWMGRCRHGFSRLVGVEMSLAQTTLIVRHVQTQMAELKKTLKFEIAGFYGFDALVGLRGLTSAARTQLYYTDIPRQSAIRELRERNARSRLSADRVRELTYNVTGDEKAADNAQAKFVLEEMKQDYMTTLDRSGLSVIKVE
jgi:hypothetical protein